MLDADLYARQALAPGSAGAQAVIERYGEQVVDPGHPGNLRRSTGRPWAASCLPMNGSGAGWRGWCIPLVRKRFAAELERLAEAPVVVLMIPLLFEAGLESLCGEIWLVDCHEQQQLARLIHRDGLTPEEALHRIGAQWPLVHKRPLADVVIDNRTVAESGKVAEHLSSQLASHLG